MNHSIKYLHFKENDMIEICLKSNLGNITFYVTYVDYVIINVKLFYYHKFHIFSYRDNKNAEVDNCQNSHQN